MVNWKSKYLKYKLKYKKQKFKQQGGAVGRGLILPPPGYIEHLGENIGDTSFENRHPTVTGIQTGLYDSEKESYITTCPRFDRLYKWSEIKSSFLMKQIIHSKVENESIYDNLTEYLQDLNERLFANLSFDDSKVYLKDELNRYMKELPNATQKDQLRSYPVAQSHVWLNDVDGLYNNFYPLWNFTKYVWYKIKSTPNTTLKNVCNIHRNTYSIIIYIFQQQILNFHDILRGARIDEDGNGKYREFYIKNNQIGIANNIFEGLRRHIPNKPDYEVEGWYHPGEVQCRVAYRGGYGKQIRKYREQKGTFDNFYGSLQCGISGSTQFILFMYLLSHLESPIVDPKKDVRDVITSACLVMTGDGGHNIREVLSGLTCSIIILSKLLKDVIHDLKWFYGKSKHTEYPEFNNNWKKDIIFLKKYLNSLKTEEIEEMKEMEIIKILYNFCYVRLEKKKVCNIDDIANVFRNLLLSLTNWYPFVKEFYNYTKDFNITGINSIDMELILKEIYYKDGNELSLDTHLYMTRLSSYEYLFNPYGHEGFSDDIRKADTLLRLQVLLASDNERYNINLDDSFKTKPDKIIRKFIKKYPSGEETLKDVNLELERIRSHPSCITNGGFPAGFNVFVSTLTVDIPFA